MHCSTRTSVGTVENKTFAEIKVGDSATLTRTVSWHDDELIAVMSGTVVSARVGDEQVDAGQFRDGAGIAMWGPVLLSILIETELPGSGTVHVGQDLRFHTPIAFGETVSVVVTVRDKDSARRLVTLECRLLGADGKSLMEGTVQVIPPTGKIRRPRLALPEVRSEARGFHHRRLVRMAQDYEALPTAIIYPVDSVSLTGAVEAAEAGLIIPRLVGPAGSIRSAAYKAGRNIDCYQIVDDPTAEDAAARGVELVLSGAVKALMKGDLHTDVLMHAIVAGKPNLRAERRVSHVFVMDVPTYARPLLVTDAAINIYPDLEAKRDIVQNAIDLAHAIGIETPRVAVLSAVETVTPGIHSTLEAAALSKMAERGQIVGGIVDGPLAFDNAVSAEAAEIKHIRSEVAGRADILVVPDLEAGNMLAKQLEYLADAEGAGIVVGARVPIILTSRADDTHSRLASAAVAVLQTHAGQSAGKARMAALAGE